MSIFFNPAKHPHRLKPQPLGEQGARYDEDWPMSELDFLETVDKQQWVLVNKDIRRRDAFAFPGFIVGVISLIMAFHFVFMEHYGEYSKFNEDITTYKNKYGNLYKINPENKRIPSFVIEEYVPFFDQEKLSLSDYFHVYYSGKVVTSPYQDTLFFSAIFVMLFF